MPLPLPALLGGAAAALALTGVHQAARLLTDHAPRMDILGMRALAEGYRAAGQTPPPEDRLYAITLTGDLVGNALYYALTGVGRPGGEWRRGLLLGLGAGIGGVVLPPLVGLGSESSARTPATAAMTVAWYTLGGLVAAAATRALRR
jgi:hypothetical protein